MKFPTMNRIAALSTILAVSLMGANGCKHAEESASAEEIPSDLKIVFGQQGTFAGRGMGYSIDASGEVVRWEGKFPGENTEASVTVEENHVRSLWKHAQDIGFLEMQDQAMSTINYFVTLTANGESRRVTWIERNEDALTPAQRFYDECRAVARSALGEDRAGEEG